VVEAGTHIPVMLQRCVRLLAPALDTPEAVVVDATVGLGGHSEAIMRQCPAARLVGLDRDPQALRASRERLAPYAERVTVLHANYTELAAVLARLGLSRVGGVLFDLGVSSPQLDDVGRGFAYAQDAPLDMRMDTTSGMTAAQVVNTYSIEELARILRGYGEERFALRIAKVIVRARTKQPITSSAQLVELIRAAIPIAARRHGGHPAKRTFQALRIEVNRELEALRRALPQAISALALGGRIVVLSYHSLEDRLAKQFLTGQASAVPPNFPVLLPEHQPVLRPLTRRPERPAAEEVAVNPRAASARLRAAEKIREAA